MDTTICTLYEGHYHYGVATLINSLSVNGFKGVFCIGYRGSIAPWAMQLKQIAPVNNWEGATAYQLETGIIIHFLPLQTDYHLTNYKQVFMLQLLAGIAKSTPAIFYFDPDIVVKTNWSFFEKWATFGVALVHEIINNDMPPSHPVRKMWEVVIEKTNKKVTRELTSYINGGFCGVSSNNIEYLHTWDEIMNTGFNYFGLTKQQFHHNFDRSYEFFRQDQDAMNIAAMCCTSPISTYGPEAMDFIHGGTVMSHSLGNHKPWKKKFLMSALQGSPPTLADKAYWDNTAGTIKTHGKLEALYKKNTIKVAAFIGRFYRKY